MRPKIHFIILATLIRVITLKLLIYSKNKNKIPSELSSIHFIQLISNNIIGITNTDKIIYYKYESSTYNLNENSTEFPFKITQLSKHLLKKSQYEYIIPCVSSKNEDKIEALGYININKLESKIYSNSENIINNNYHCGLNEIDSKNYFILFHSNSNDTNNKLIDKGYNFLFSNNTFNHIISINYNHSLSNTSNSDSIYFKNYDIIVIFYLESINNYLQIFYLFNTTSNLNDKSINYINEKILISDFIGNDYESLSNIILYSFNDDNKISISHNYNNYFYLHYINYAPTNNKVKLESDKIKRKGNYTNINFQKMNDEYFILCMPNYSILYFYLFNFSLKKQINIMFENKNFQTSSIYLFKSYDESNLLMINDNLDVYELDLIQCKNDLIFQINNFNKYSLDISDLYFSEFINDTEFNKSNLYLSFYNIDQILLNKSIVIMKGKKSDEQNYSNIDSVNINEIYSEITYQFIENNKGIFNVNYILYYDKYYNFILPSYLCSSKIVSLFMNYNCKSLDQVNDICKECVDDYYKLEYNENDLHEQKQRNCYKKDEEIDGYFYNKNKQIFQRCYDTCLTCNSQGNSKNHNCIKCNDGYENLNNYINDTNLNNCVTYCNKYYDTWYIDINTNEFICQKETLECPIDYLDFDQETHQCIYNKEKGIIYRNNKILNDALNSNDTNEVIELLMDNPDVFYTPLKPQINISDEIIIYNYDSSVSNDYKNIINLKECEDLLYKEYNISRNEGLFVSIILINSSITHNSSIDYSTNQIEYAFFSKQKEYLNLSICKSEIEVYFQMDLNNNKTQTLKNQIKNMKSVYGIDLLNISDSFFHDYCLPFTSEEKKDVILKDRVKSYYYNNPFCDSNCEYNNLFIDNMTIKCTCKPKNEINLQIQQREIKEYNINDFHVSNIKLILCYKSIFSFNALKSIGFYCYIVILFFQAFSIKRIIYYLNKPNETNKNCPVKSKKIKDKQKEVGHMTNKNSQNSKKPQILTFSSCCKSIQSLGNKNNANENIIDNSKVAVDSRLNILENLHLNKPEEVKRNNNNIKLHLINPKYLKALDLNFNNSNSNNEFDSNNNNNIIKNDDSKNKINNSNSKNIQFSQLNQADFSKDDPIYIHEVRTVKLPKELPIVKNEQKTNKQVIALHTIEESDETNNNINGIFQDVDIYFNSEVKNSVSKTMIKKKILGLDFRGYNPNLENVFFLFMFASYICLIFSVITFFYDEEDISKIFNHKGNYYKFNSEIIKIWMTLFVNYGFNFLIRIIIWVVPVKNIKIKIIIVIVVFTIVNLLLAYYSLCFYIIYINTSKYIITNTAISFLLHSIIQLISVGLLFIMKNNKDKFHNKFLYFIGEFLFLL